MFCHKCGKKPIEGAEFNPVGYSQNVCICA